MEEPIKQLNVAVLDSLRARFHAFCIVRKFHMQDLIPVLMKKVMAEAESDQPSRFVREALEEVTPAPKIVPTPRKVVSLGGRKPRGYGGRRPKDTHK
jgi:hypothetical protein